MKKQILPMLFMLLSFTVGAQTEEPKSENESAKVKPTLNFKGYSQIWYGYGAGNSRDLNGFNLQYARINPYGKITDQLTWRIQFGFDRQAAGLLDAALNYKWKDQLQFELGQFAPPAAKASALTDELWSTTTMNIIQYPITSTAWGTANNLMGQRALGFAVHGKLFDNKLTYAVMASNPSTVKPADDAFGASMITPNNKHINDGYHGWSRIEYKPIKGLGIGAFYNKGEYQNTNVNYLNESYGFHIAYRQGKYWAMTEFMEGKTSTTANPLFYKGYFAEVGYMIKKIQPVIRFEEYMPYMNTDALKNDVSKYTNYHCGLNYHMNERLKVMVNYVIRDEEMNLGTSSYKNNLMLVCVQYMFSDK